MRIALLIFLILVGAMVGIVIWAWPPHFQIEDVFNREFHREKLFVVLLLAAIVSGYLAFRHRM